MREKGVGFQRRFLLPHSSSASRFTAGALAFFILSQSGDRPKRVERVLPFRDDALNPKLAGVPKNSLAVALHVLVKSDARVSLGQHHLQCSLAALKRIGPQVVTIQLDQVEGV